VVSVDGHDWEPLVPASTRHPGTLCLPNLSRSVRLWLHLSVNCQRRQSHWVRIQMRRHKQALAAPPTPPRGDELKGLDVLSPDWRAQHIAA